MKSLITTFSETKYYNMFSNLFDWLNTNLFILTEDDEVCLKTGFEVDDIDAEVFYKCSKGNDIIEVISEKDVKRINNIFYLFDICLLNIFNNREVLSTSEKMNHKTLFTSIKDLINKLEKDYPHYFSLDLYLPWEHKPRLHLCIEPLHKRIDINYLEEVEL